MVFAVLLAAVLREEYPWGDCPRYYPSNVGYLCNVATSKCRSSPARVSFGIGICLSWGLYAVTLQSIDHRVNVIHILAWVALFALPQVFIMSCLLDDYSTINPHWIDLVCLHI